MAIFPDILPDTFSIAQAADLLNWQGTLPGLAHSLASDGYVKFRVAATVNSPSRFIWRRRARPIVPDNQCACRCHTGTCGANDMDLAERVIRLIEKLRLIDVKAIRELEHLVDRAGVDHAQAALKAADYDSDVPF